MHRKSLYTKRLGIKVANEAQSSNAGRYHVISGDSKRWTVVSEGKVRPVKVFATQKEAISFARKTALLKTGVVFIHGKTGMIRDEISFAK
jgi:hypothetical protein